jgi:hydrogenase maturation protease
MEARAPKLFVGVGNVLSGDDGVGVRAAELMMSLPLTPDVEVFEAGTALLEMAGILELRERVVVVDAIDAGAEPGQVFRLLPEQIRPHESLPLSLHQLGLLHALDETYLRGRAPGEVVILAVQVGDLAGGMKLSSAEKASLFELLEEVVDELDLDLDIRDCLPVPRVESESRR